MCGIAGFTRFDHPTGDKQALFRMGESIAHRGPDAHGEYLDDHIGLCHRRLSIIDLSAAGNQPMFSSDGNLILVFNGEIYNFIELRKDMESLGYQFRSRTDSEVILALYQHYGKKCLSKMNGMFAFAIWDREKNELFLARDRIGKKPLYYYSNGNQFIFGSEIKAIFEIKSVKRNIRADAIYDFFAYQYVPETKSIFDNIYKLKPGHWLCISRLGIEIQKYWDLSFHPRLVADPDEISFELLQLIESSTKQRMTSDVPLGAFLSGGIDSSGIVALMARNSTKPVLTCSIGFASSEFDEIKYAKLVSEQYKTTHHELVVKENILARLEYIVRYFDEPFADQSLVPTFFVSQLARQKVTVALTGDGGDENFAGYGKYGVDQTENRLRQVIPEFIRKSLLPHLVGPLEKGNLRLLNRASTLFSAMSKSPAEAFYLTNAYMTDHLWNRIAKSNLKKELGDYHPSSQLLKYYHSADAEDHLSRVLYTDIKTYLPGDILVKVDRMSMANSLEVRAPLLDYHVVEYAAGIHASLKLHGRDKKHILKKAFKSLLPPDILYRKKMGFSVPLAHWLRNDLRAICGDKLFADENGLTNYFDMGEIRKLWLDHQSGAKDYSTILWSLLMFELWWGNYVD